MRKKLKFGLVVGCIIILCSVPFLLLTKKKKFQSIPLQEEMVIGANESDKNQMFYNLVGVFTDFRNNYYLLDKGNYRIQVFDKNGKFIRTIGKEGQGPGEFASPVAGAIYNRKYILIADNELLRVNIYDLEGNFISSFKTKGEPSDLITTEDNRIFLAYSDKGGRFIHEYNIEGDLLRSFGKVKEEWLLLFSDAAKICSDNEENIYVCFRYLNRIQKYNSKGKLLKEIQAVLPFEVQPPKIKGGGYSVRTIFLDIACNEDNIYLITAPQGLIKSILKKGSYLIILNKQLNQKQIFKLPFLTISLSFDRYQRLLLCDINFLLHVCNVLFRDSINDK